MHPRMIALETANAGIVTIPETLFVNWFNELDKNDLKSLGFSIKQYTEVERIISQGRLQTSYSPVVYDFILISLNNLVNRGILKP